MSKLYLFFGFLVFLLLASTSNSQSWPMFHNYLNHTGFSSSTAPTTAHLLWNYTTGSGIYSSPAVANGMIFIGSYDNHVYALNETNGQQIWNYTTGSYVLSSPAVANGMIFIGSWDNNVYALNETNGQQIWNYTTGSYVYSSPAVANGMIFIGSFDNHTYALNETNGQQIWNYTTGSYVYSSPAVANGMIFIGSEDNHVYALNETNGQQIWNYTTGNVIISSPAVANGMIFIGSRDNHVYALNETNGQQIWNYTTGNVIISSPAVANGMIFIGSEDNHVYALNETNGQQIWNYTTGNYVDSSPAVANGMIFIGSWDNNVYALNETNGQQIWNYTTGNSIRSSPAVADGMIFIGSGDDHVYAFSPNIPNIISSCGNVGAPGGVLTGNIIASGNCINITANNVVINCSGYAIIGNGSGDGFDVNNLSNVSIINCLIENFTTGVNASQFNNLTIQYSNFTNNSNSITTWSGSSQYGWYGTISYGLNLFNNQFLDRVTFNNNPYSCNAIYNSTIENNTINGGWAGHHLGNSTISFNNFTGHGNWLGGDVNFWSFNNITNNYFSNYSYEGSIYIALCSYNYFYNNTFSGGVLVGQPWCSLSQPTCMDMGGWLDYQTGNNTFDYNNFTRTNVASPFIGLMTYSGPPNPGYFFENITTNNWVDGKSVLYYSPWSNNICPSNTQLNFGNNHYGFVGLVNCTNVTVTGTFYTGLGVGFTNNSLFNNCNASNTANAGLVLAYSTNNTIQNSNITTAGGYSIWISNSSSNNFSNNSIQQTSGGTAIAINGYSNNNYFQNTYMPLARTGIWIQGSSNNNIFNNLSEGSLTYGTGIQLGNWAGGNAINTTIENSIINTSGSRTPLYLWNSSVTVINTTLNSSNTNFLNAYSFYDSINSTVPNFNIPDSLSSALIQWFLNVRVQDSNGYGVSNVTVNVTNNTGLVYQNLTDSNGYTGWNVLSQELITNSSITSYTPYTASAIFNGCASRVYSNTTQLTSSQLLILTLKDLLRTLQLVSVSPSIYNIYNPKQNISFTFEVFNPSCLSTSFNITVYTPQGSFNCNSSTNGYSSVYVPCGYMNLTSYINTINVTLIPNTNGWSAQPPYQNFTFYTSISNNVVVPDSNILIILSLTFIAFFGLRKKLEGGKSRKN